MEFSLQKKNLLEGKDFYSSDPQLIKDKQKAYKFYTRFNANFDKLYGADKYLKGIFGRIGKNVKVVPPLYFSYGYQIFIGNNVHFNVGVYMGDAGKIKIRDNVMIGPYAQIYTTNHNFLPARRGFISTRDVLIEENVWVGGAVIILPGIRIGKDSIIGAGSVVTKDVPEKSIIVGNPAKILKNVEGD